MNEHQFCHPYINFLKIYCLVEEDRKQIEKKNTNMKTSVCDIILWTKLNCFL